MLLISMFTQGTPIDWVATFSNFGYPALVSGVLLYIIVNNLEKVRVRMEKIDQDMIVIQASMKELRDDLAEQRRIK